MSRKFWMTLVTVLAAMAMLQGVALGRDHDKDRDDRGGRHQGRQERDAFRRDRDHDGDRDGRRRGRDRDDWRRDRDGDRDHDGLRRIHARRDRDDHDRDDFRRDDDRRPPGWSRGRKTGWGDCDVPPGQAKKSGCRDRDDISRHHQARRHHRVSRPRTTAATLHPHRPEKGDRD